MNRRIRILITTSNFNTAGSGKVIYDLVNGLDKTKVDIEIACGHADGAFFKTIQSLGVPIHVFNTKTNYRPYSTLYFRIHKISSFFRTQKYDLIHSWQWSNDWTEAMAAKLAGTKWMYTKKAMGFKSRHWKIKSYLADYIVTVNDEMRAYFPNKKSQQLIPFGIDTSYYNSEPFEKTSSTSTFDIITVANLVPVKGIEVLIHAIAQLNDPTIRLRILGSHSNDYGKEMQALSHRLKLDTQVLFLGKQPDIRPYVAKSDLYVIPTLDKGEGMPMALVEAMSMGTPVLGSNISGINYVLKEFSELLFEPSDSKALAKKIKYMQSLTSGQRIDIGDTLRAYCLAQFTMERFIHTHELLYEQLISDGDHV